MAFKSQSPWKINVVGLLLIVCWNIISFVSLPVSVIPPRSLLNGVIYFCVIANIQISAARKKKLRQSFCSFLIQAGCFSSAFCCDTDKNDGSEKELTEVFWVTGQGLDSFPDLLHFFFFLIPQAILSWQTRIAWVQPQDWISAYSAHVPVSPEPFSQTSVSQSPVSCHLIHQSSESKPPHLTKVGMKEHLTGAQVHPCVAGGKGEGEMSVLFLWSQTYQRRISVGLMAALDERAAATV